MVGRNVQRGEVEMIFLDFGAVGHIETDGTEDLLDAFDDQRDRMQPAPAGAAPRQRNIQTLAGQTGFQPLLADGLGALGQQRLDALLDLVERLAPFGLFGPHQLAQLPEQRGQRAGLAQKGGLGIGQGCFVPDRREAAARLFDQRVQIMLHVFPCPWEPLQNACGTPAPARAMPCNDVSSAPPAPAGAALPCPNRICHVRIALPCSDRFAMFGSLCHVRIALPCPDVRRTKRHGATTQGGATTNGTA